MPGFRFLASAPLLPGRIRSQTRLVRPKRRDSRGFDGEWDQFAGWPVTLVAGGWQLPNSPWMAHLATAMRQE